MIDICPCHEILSFNLASDAVVKRSERLSSCIFQIYCSQTAQHDPRQSPKGTGVPLPAMTRRFLLGLPSRADRLQIRWICPCVSTTAYTQVLRPGSETKCKLGKLAGGKSVPPIPRSRNNVVSLCESFLLSFSIIIIQDLTCQSCRLTLNYRLTRQAILDLSLRWPSPRRQSQCA